MKIVFGPNLDSFAAPETVSGDSYEVGDCVLGPAGLLSLLEMRLGCGTPPASKTVRIGQYLSKLRAADDGAQYFSASLRADAWSTAEYLLGLRDELVLAGWDGQEISGAGRRLAALANIENSGSKLQSGLCDRLSHVVRWLKKQHEAGVPQDLQIAEICMTTNRDAFPFLWREVFRLLEERERGPKIYPRVDLQIAQANTDLGLIQGILLRQQAASALSGDGTFVVLEFDNELLAAEALAQWLAAQNEPSRLCIVRGAGVSLLDATFRRQGLPGVGLPKSRNRSAMQLLQLAFDTLWQPASAETLIEFLMLPYCPVPRSAAWHFVEALRQESGVGGNQWREAWERAREARSQALVEQGRSDPELSNLLRRDEEDWKRWLEPQRTPNGQRIDAQHVQLRCSLLAQWLTRRLVLAAPRDAQMLSDLVEQTNDLSAALEASGMTSLTKIQLDRIIESIIERGVSSGAVAPEAARWMLVDQPGQIWAPVDTVVWWGFQFNPMPRQTHWSCIEQDALRHCGIELLPAQSMIEAEADSWRCAVVNACQRVVLIRPTNLSGGPAVAHPLWHEISAMVPSAQLDKITVDAGALLYEPKTELAGEVLARSELSRRQLPVPTREWQVIPGCIAPREVESSTSIQRLLGCSLAWSLRYPAGIKPSRTLLLPSTEKLVGALAHAIVARLFEERKSWNPHEAASRCDDLFDHFVVAMASPLLAPGKSMQLLRARQMIRESIRTLVQLIDDAHLSVVGCEVQWQRALLDSTQFEGTIDLLLAEAGGRLVVIDLKWIGNAKYKRDEIRRNAAVQLASYSWLVEEESTGYPTAGYFLLRQNKLLHSCESPFGSFHHEKGMDLKQCWEAVRSEFVSRMEKLSSGLIAADGIMPHVEQSIAGAIQIEPPCGICEFGRICGKTYSE